MFQSPLVLQDSRKYNSTQGLNPIEDLTLNSSAIKKNEASLSQGHPTTGSSSRPPMEGIINDAHPHFEDSAIFISTMAFSSPIRTLAESIKDPEHLSISTYDLVEAYNVLSTRMRTLIHVSASSNSNPSVLTIFKEQSTCITECLSRDLRNAFPSRSSDSQRQQHSFSNDSSMYFDSYYLNGSNTKEVNDNLILAQYALCFASDIFSHPSVYSNFTRNQLRTVFLDVLSLSSTATPLINFYKLSALSVWTLKMQQLPTSILKSLSTGIVSSLRNSISREVAGHTGKLDAIKAVRSILEKHPSLIHPFFEILVLILNHLNSESHEVKMHAALALTAFAMAKLKSDIAIQFPKDRVSALVEKYLVIQASKPEFIDFENLLPSIIKSALTGDSIWNKKGPPFAFTVASCLLVLLGHAAFSNPLCLKFFFAIFAQCRSRKRDNIRAGHSEIWRILIWAFSQISVSSENEEGAGGPSKLQEIRSAAFLVARQELGNGLAVTLLSSLLLADGPPEVLASNCTNALGLISDLANSKDTQMKNEGLMILGRLMAAIGDPSVTSSTLSNSSDIPFSVQLIDGSLLSQNSQDIRIPKFKTPLQLVRPLQETEVLEHWDHLSKLWIISAQGALASEDEFPPEIFQVWQALLLARSDLTQERKHLMASPSFASRVASMVCGFTLALDSVESQDRFLLFIGKLWAVMKNVFTLESLSSPAEIILATLLKKQFDLVYNRIKDLWSSLLADLISVGIPTLLHVLHLRSESQEETEVTRQLWIVLAQHGPSITADEDWMDLLHFLAMPLGVWDMPWSEIEIWENIFVKALKIGEVAFKSQHDVVSYFLGLLGEAKLTSTSHFLLRQSLAGPTSQIDSKLLSLIDDSLLHCYDSSVEKKACALDILRVIGQLISNTHVSEIVFLILAIQNGLCCWIADNQHELDEHEDRELTSIVYINSLEILERLEPSIEVLKLLAPFLHSVFIRVRGDGPLAFFKFWRCTYHLRPDIPQNEYPISIKQCLKAWSDFTGGSLGDGISLDSGSLSLKTFTIPDSQPAPTRTDAELELSLHEKLFHAGNLLANRTRGDSSVGTATPTPKGKVRKSIESTSGRTSQRPEDAKEDTAGDHLDNEEGLLIHENVAQAKWKRSSEFDTPLSPKRRRVNLAQKDTPRCDEEVSKTGGGVFGSSKRGNMSVSEPVTRRSSILLQPPKSTSQPSQSRPKFRTPSPRGNTRDKTFPIVNNDEWNSSPIAAEDLPRSSDDYDTWEQCLSVEDLRDVQAELEPSREKDFDTEHVAEPQDSNNLDVLSPSLGAFPLRSKVRERSQTAPEISLGSHQQQDSASPYPLRRSQTSPLYHKKSSLAQLDALQQAYAIVADTGTSQIDVQDIMHARRLANQINQALDEQMAAKFGTKK